MWIAGFLQGGELGADVQAAVDEEGARTIRATATVEPVATPGSQPQKGPAIFMNHTLQFTNINPTFFMCL